jgi:S-adenosylmethionine:tRNA ribosyltransferase-isomerase
VTTSPPSDRFIDSYDFHLPKELIAQRPLERRDASRLLVLDKATGAISHSTITELGSFLRAGDMLVANNSRVIHARLRGHRPTGGQVELLLLKRLEDATWEALARPSRRLRRGEVIRLDPADPWFAGVVDIEIVERRSDGLVQIAFVDPKSEAHLERVGHVPLPPYITAQLDDPSRYQTTYASPLGSAAAPTAGLHFTDALREQLRSSGIGWAEVTLHVGIDTFRPVTVDRLDDHKMHSEWCEVSVETVELIRETKARQSRVIAIGTTAARTLETLGQVPEGEELRPYSGTTTIFIAPGHQWRVVDGMLTNFHLPRSTLVVMVSALASREAILEAYREAIEHRYRFFSFGDAMLIL